MSPAFSHDFLKRLRAFSKLSSGSTITLVTRNSPLSEIPEVLPVYHAPPQAATWARVLQKHRVWLGGALPGPRCPATRWPHSPHHQDYQRRGARTRATAEPVGVKPRAWARHARAVSCPARALRRRSGGVRSAEFELDIVGVPEDEDV